MQENQDPAYWGDMYKYLRSELEYIDQQKKEAKQTESLSTLDRFRLAFDKEQEPQPDDDEDYYADEESSDDDIEKVD